MVFAFKEHTIYGKVEIYIQITKKNSRKFFKGGINNCLGSWEKAQDSFSLEESLKSLVK